MSRWHLLTHRGITSMYWPYKRDNKKQDCCYPLLSNLGICCEHFNTWTSFLKRGQFNSPSMNNKRILCDFFDQFWYHFYSTVQSKTGNMLAKIDLYFYSNNHTLDLHPRSHWLDMRQCRILFLNDHFIAMKKNYELHIFKALFLATCNRWIT